MSSEFGAKISGRLLSLFPFGPGRFSLFPWMMTESSKEKREQREEKDRGERREGDSLQIVEKSLGDQLDPLEIRAILQIRCCTALSNKCRCSILGISVDWRLASATPTASQEILGNLCL